MGGATGILHHLAQAKGFDDVASYLKSLTARKGTDEFDESDGEGEEKPEKLKKRLRRKILAKKMRKTRRMRSRRTRRMRSRKTRRMRSPLKTRLYRTLKETKGCKLL